MTHLVDYCEEVIENNENEEDTFTEIKRKLLDDFDTAETVRKVLKGASKIGDSREPVKVYLRVKPLTGKEIAAGESQGCLEIENYRTVALHPPKTSFNFKHRQSRITGETIQRFTFTRVFGPETNQKRFFEDTSLDVVRDFINGQNCLVFSYGITNAGKTYTILGNSENIGVLPRTINILFNSFKNQNYERSNLKPKMFCDVHKLSSIQEEEEESKKKLLLSLNDVPTYHESISSTDLSLGNSSQEQCSTEDVNLSSLLDVTSVDIDDQGPIQFCLWISFAEIYNEHIYDLLEPISMNKDGKRTVLRVGNDRKSNPYIKGLTEIHVNNADEALKLLKIGRKNQKIASTKLNETSSRSHCIFTLKILRVVNTKEPHVARVSRLSFVDLAGSERYAKTQNTGVRLKEAGNINTSIMTLGKCVELLRYNQNHVNNQKNVPFRESKLTRLFQGFFCGKGKASMIVNVNQCASAFDETLHALKFSAIAKKVTTVVHEPPPAAADITNPPEPSTRSTRSSVAWAADSLPSPAGNKARIKLKEIHNVPEESVIERTTSVGNQDYQKIIVVLQEQLIEERREKALMEVKIREEVCQEMAEQLVQIEKSYNDRMIEEQRATEELYEKRIDILTKSVKKARKRPRIEREEEDDDELVSSVLLHKEQVKNKELSEHILELEEKLKIMEEERAKESAHAGKQLFCIEEKIARKDIEVQVETQSKIVCEMTTEVERLKEEIRVKDDNIKSSEVSLFQMEEMKAKVVELSDALEQKNKLIKQLEGEIARLEEDKEKNLENFKKELANRDEIINILKNESVDEKAKLIESESLARQRVEELEQQVSSLKNDNGEMCKSLKELIAQREERVAALEKELAETLKQKNDGTTKESKKNEEREAEIQEEINRLKVEKEKEIDVLRKEIEHRDEKILRWTNVMTKNEKLMERIDEASEKLKKKDFESTELVEKMKSMNASKTEECEKLRNELTCRGEQIEQLERTLKDCKLELEAKCAQLMVVKKVQGGKSSTPTKSAQNNLVKQLEKRIQESTTALDKKNCQLISKNNVITKLENNVKELRRVLSEKEQEFNKLRAKNEQLQTNKSKEQSEDNKDVTIDELNAQLKEQECNLLNKHKEKEEVEENLKFVEGELEILSGKEKELQQELKKVKGEYDEMKEEASKWKLEVENHREVEGNMKKQLEAQSVIAREHESNLEELKRDIARKEDDLRQCKELHSQRVAELNEANKDLQQNFNKALRDLANVQATVNLRNKKLEDMENLDSSLKEEHRYEKVQLKKELENARDELRKRDENLNKMKLEMEKKFQTEILKVNGNWEAATEQMKRGIEEQEEVLAQMEKDLVSKDDEVVELRSQVEKLQQLDTQTVEKLSKENEDLDDQCERYKIKIFELETAVEKLQQDVKKETTKKDTATQALRDGLEIVKIKKLEYETKINEVDKETEEMKKGFEIKIADLEQEVTRLKSVSSSGSDEKTDSTEKESGNSSGGDVDYDYKPVEVESFDVPSCKDRVEIDVTPITGTGLPKGGKKTSSTKTKSGLKRKSSDLTLKEIQQQIKSAKKENCSEDEFTPVSVKKLRKTRSSSVSGRSTRQSKANMISSPSLCTLSTLEEDSENTNPQISHKSGTSGKRRFLNKFPFPEALKTKTENTAETKSRRKRKLFKKTDISAPLMDSPASRVEKLDTPTSKAQEIIMRRLRSRDVTAAR